MTEEIEYEEVTIKPPKTVVDFIRDMEGDVAEHIAHCIVDLTTSWIESVNAKYFIAKYNLKSTFKKYGVLPTYCK